MPKDRRRFFIDILLEEKTFQDHQNERLWSLFFEKILAATFAHLNILAPEVHLSILLTHDEKMRELNHTFRGKNKPTNVLSFPSDEFDDEGGGFLGDLAFGKETISSEHPDFLSHMTHLTIHGILHLLGFDHEEDQDANIMENHEIEILKTFNIQNPYREL